MTELGELVPVLQSMVKDGGSWAVLVVLGMKWFVIDKKAAAGVSNGNGVVRHVVEQLEERLSQHDQHSQVHAERLAEMIRQDAERGLVASRALDKTLVQLSETVETLSKAVDRQAGVMERWRYPAEVLLQTNVSSAG